MATKNLTVKTGVLTQKALKKHDQEYKPPFKTGIPSSIKNSSVASSSKSEDGLNTPTNSVASRFSSSSSVGSPISSIKTPTSFTSASSTKPLYLNAKTVYENIKSKMAKMTQQSKTQLPSEEIKPIQATQMTELPQFYLFVVLDSKIVGIFETKSNFKLESTNKFQTTNVLPNNYITSERFDFNSVIKIDPTKDYTDSNSIPDGNTNYIGMDSYVPLDTDRKKIDFYVYDAESNLKTTYFTYGRIFIYGEGIGSTCEIKELKDGDSIPDRKDVLPHGTSKNKFDPRPATYKDLITEIKSKIFGADAEQSLDMKKVYIHYLNAISPDDLKVVLPGKVKSVLKILYVNISAPSSGKPDTYNLLHKYINYYYAYKKRSIRKIGDYLDEQTEYSQFVMPIFDFFEFLMFLKDKESNNSELIRCCIDIYNSYIANYDNVFKQLGITDKIIDEIQKKLLAKQKKIHTYLQIVSDTPESTNKRYEIQLNKKEGGNYGEKGTKTNDSGSIDDSTSMMLTFKTKTGTETATKKDMFESQNYKFGPFDYIFKPDFSIDDDSKYKDIVKSPKFNNPIITKIAEGSPMMFSFHGPGGSGKTKVLKKVLIDLCNNLGSKQKYTTLEISFKEIFNTYDNKQDEHTTKQFQLTFTNNQFKINVETSHEPYHAIKLKGTKKTFTTENSLSDVLNYFLDEDRLVKGFLTNDKSSRSHVLCFLKMSKPNDSSSVRHIVFADLAGNEKKYDCSTEAVLNKFKGIKKDGSKNSFYSDEFDANGENFDSQKGGTLKNEMVKNSTKFFMDACIHRRIEGDFINESLKDYRRDLEYMVDVKNKENEFYVPDIYTNITDTKGLKTCLQNFCFGKTNCFRLSKVDEIKEPTSVILNSVYSQLNLGTAETFYNKLEVCMFGVLNIISKDTPPPTNYVDINTVKSVIHGKDEFTLNNNPGVFYTFKKEFEITKNYAKRINSVNSSFPEKYIYDLLELCYADIDKREKTTLTLSEIQTFNGVFHAIDDENAKTAIGTLEFMNRISKFNVVNSICLKNNDNVSYKPLNSA